MNFEPLSVSSYLRISLVNVSRLAMSAMTEHVMNRIRMKSFGHRYQSVGSRLIVVQSLRTWRAVRRGEGWQVEGQVGCSG